MGFLRASAIVVVLIVSVVGIPFGLWFLVRYRFMAQVVVTENRSGREALTRSAQLVTGRWWHTALVLGLFNLLVATSGDGRSAAQHRPRWMADRSALVVSRAVDESRADRRAVVMSPQTPYAILL